MGRPKRLGRLGELLAAAMATSPEPFLPALREWKNLAAGGAHTQKFAIVDPLAEGRRLEPGGHADVCRAVALRLMPTPAVKSYDECFTNKIIGTTHDWSIPGAEVAAQIECWCRHNLTATIQEYSCCDHGDIYPMCSVDCSPDCTSQLALDCVQECPSMCFESAEYIVDAALCKDCDWAKCWSVVGCLTNHAATQIENGTLARTCHETEFRAGSELTNYMECWKNAPKHSSHWNILSSLVHCMCREGMDKKARDTHCCDSVMYGAGVCGLQCLSEAACTSQEAQTCVHGCQRKCPAYELVANEECKSECLRESSPCRKYLSCRPPSVDSHVCDDGQWPEAASGCCKSDETGIVGCPRLCETQRVWRLDRTRTVPWWARWYTGDGIIAQCTCVGCPESPVEKREKLKRTVEDSVWDNGQAMLVDIARREGLQLGPNRRMQELMLRRNSEIISTISQFGDSGETDQRIGAINDRYALLITDAARQGDDEHPDGGRLYSEGKRDEQNLEVIIAIIVSCSCVLLVAVAVATWLLIRKRKRESPISTFGGNPQVVIGNPVPPETSAATGPMTGAPVTVAAPTKAKGSDSGAKELS